MDKIFQFILRVVLAAVIFSALFFVLIKTLRFFGLNFENLKHSSRWTALLVAYVITSSITTFDMRLIQAKRHGNLPPDEPLLPVWTGFIIWIDWGLAIWMVVLNWKFALLIIFIKFVLQVLPVLETMGNMLMSPFRPR